MSARLLKIAGVVSCFIFLAVPLSVLHATTFTPIAVDQEHPVIGNIFQTEATASGGTAGSIYYLKCRIGQTSASLGEGQTLNENTNVWLDDTSAWIDMPTIVVANDGSWHGTIPCRIKISAVDESKMLFIRACLKTNDACGSSFQSAVSLILSPILPTVTLTPTNTPTQTPTATKSPTNTPAPSPSIVINTPTILPSSKPTSYVRIISTVLFSENTVSSDGSVLGQMNESVEVATNSSDGLSQKRPYITALLFVGIGLAVLAGVSVLKIRYTEKV